MMVFHWSLSYCKSPQVSRTLLSILAVLNNVVLWMVSIRSPTSKSSSPFNNPLVTVPKAPITIGAIVTFMFQGFFQISSKVEVLILLFTFLIIIIYSFRIFHISVSWWFFTGVWVTASLLKSPGLVSGFWPFSVMPIIWIVSTRLPTSKSSRPFNNSLVIVPKSPITIGTIVTFMFRSFFNFLPRSTYLSFFSHSFRFILLSAGTAKSTTLQILFFRCWLYKVWSLAWIRWSVSMLKSHRSLCVSFSRTGAGLCIHHLLVWSNLNFLHISQWITLPTQSCLAFCANLLHSLIMWLIVSSLSPHSLHLLFCCVLSILALIWLVLMALSCAAIRRDSVSLLRFPFFSQVQDFCCQMLFICRLKRLLSCLFSHYYYYYYYF